MVNKMGDRWLKHTTRQLKEYEGFRLAVVDDLSTSQLTDREREDLVPDEYGDSEGMFRSDGY